MSLAIRNLRFFVMFFPLTLMAQLALFWRIRRLSLPLEFNRPVSRQAFQKELAAAFAIDLTPIAVFLAMTIAISWNLHSSWTSAGWQFNWARAMIDAPLLFVSTAPLVVGLPALFVLLERTWLAWVLTCSIGFGAVTGMFVFTVEAGSQLTERSVVVGQLWIPAVVGAALLGYALRRWQKLELGRLE